MISFLSKLLVLVVCLVGSVFGQESVLYSFQYSQGSSPSASLIFDKDGNLYGTVSSGGAYYFGAVFELTPSAGGWTETVLHNFDRNGADGIFPQGALTLDASGNLYGVTNNGGSKGEGVVFELSPDGSGGWTETILHTFVRDGVDGAHPMGAVVFDAAGNLYGATEHGGTSHVGTVFELTPVGDGTWSETILHNFVHDGTDGAYPVGPVTFDAAGNLYGVTSGGGAGRYGTAFELTPGAGGWTETILHNFVRDGSDGAGPNSIIADAAGNLYGTTISGGSYQHGAVFGLTPSGGGTWSESILHNFEGERPYSVTPNQLALDAAGNLYGTTEYGGNTQCPLGCGEVYKLSAASGGSWTATLLHAFQADGVDGTNPLAGVVLDSSGNVYGTTLVGGTYGSGTVFEIMP